MSFCNQRERESIGEKARDYNQGTQISITVIALLREGKFLFFCSVGCVNFLAHFPGTAAYDAGVETAQLS